MLQGAELKQVMLIIPAYNEEKTVAGIVSEALRLGVGAVIVVDDRSDDLTAMEASRAGAEVLSLSDNLGAWGAAQAGLRLALNRGFQIGVTIDADGQHPPANIPSLLAPILTKAANTVVGSCTARGTKGRHIAWQWLKILSGLHVDDLTSGMRAYDSQSMEVLSSRSGSYLDYQDVGPLLLLHKAGLTISEVSISMSPRTEGKSKIFHSWFSVAYYLWYSSILSISRRPARFSKRRRKQTEPIDGSEG